MNPTASYRAKLSHIRSQTVSKQSSRNITPRRLLVPTVSYTQKRRIKKS